MIANVRADQHQLVRVIDESGEDYLYSADYFATIKLPGAVEEVFMIAA